MDGSTRSTLFGVLVLVGKPVSAPELVRLCRPLGVSATNVKSHLTRLTAEGVVIRTGPRRSHRYGISPLRQGVVQAIRGRLERLPDEAWDGAWLMTALKVGARRSERERLRTSLWFEGFRPCAADTFLRPAWPRAWAVERAQDLAPVAAASVIGPLAGTVHLGQVRKLYGLASIDVQARRLTRRIEGLGNSVRDPREAFKARSTVGGLVAQLMSHVPVLPHEIWGDLTGLIDLQSAYARFERRVNGPANLYVDNIVSGAARRGAPVANRHARRAVMPRTNELRRSAR